MFVEKSGLGPFDGVRVTVDTSGAVEVVTGAASVGQGVETVVAQICADALGVDYRCIRVVHGQTDRIAYGMGAFASRVTVMTGEATRIAATKVRDKALAAAASLLQSRAGDARHHRRQGGAQIRRSRTVGHARRNRPRARARRKTPRRCAARPVGGRLVRVAPHDLSLRRASRRGARRPRQRSDRRRALRRRLRHRQGGQSDAGRGPDRRRRGARSWRRAVRGIPL